MKRTRTQPAARGTIELIPRHWRAGESLPAFYAREPRTGWDLDSSTRAARAYAVAEGLGTAGAAAAFRALADHADPSLRRAEIRARRAGTDLLAVAS